MTVLELLLTQTGDNFPELLGRALRQPEAATKSGMAAAAALVVRGLARQAHGDGGGALSAALEDHDGRVFLDLPGLLQRATFAAELQLALGAERAADLRELQRATGWSQPKARRLLGIMATLILGMLGARQRQDGFGGAGLVRLLDGWLAMGE